MTRNPKENVAPASPQPSGAIGTVGASGEMLAALKHVRSIVADGAATGFNWKDGDWAERLYASQQMTSTAVQKAEAALSAAPVGPVAVSDEMVERAESAEATVREARDVLGRLFRFAPDVGVDEFHDALRDAHLLIAKIDGAE